MSFLQSVITLYNAGLLRPRVFPPFLNSFVTRNPSRLNRDEHLVLSTQNVKPAQFAKNMLGTSVENMWGIVKMVVDKFMREEVEEGT